MLLLTTLKLISLAMVVTAGSPTDVVNTTSGPVQGQILTTAVSSMRYANFAGIRYAKPPVGYLRFQPPVPIDPWTETLNATLEGSKCPQLHHNMNRFIGSEDCLFLRVVTPVTNLRDIPEQLKAVLVWFHGGGFQFGRSSSDTYSPDHLIERDVVFAACSYRLGSLGFLNLNHPNATGNAGLKDQNLCLKWIKANIRNFGGNPENITIFGQSAGAASVGFHILSDASEGLFHGAISMSGTPLASWGFSKQTESLIVANKLGMAMGSNSTDRETLLKIFYAASAEELLTATNGTPTFLPTLEDANLGTDVFLSECSISKYISGNFSKVPQILGFLQFESIFDLMRPETIISSIIEALRTYDSPILSEMIYSAGSLEMLAKEIKNYPFSTIVNETTDIRFASVIDLTQNLIVAHNDDKPVYYYHLTFDSNVSVHDQIATEKFYGAVHNDDICYIFWCSFADDGLGPTGPHARTVHRVSTMWTNFAKYGDPTPNWINDDSLNVTWPSSGRAGLALEIGNELKVTSRPTNLNREIVKMTILDTIGTKNGCATSQLFFYS